jgi:hypothetical protein
MSRIREITRKGAQDAGKTAAELAGQRNSWFDTAIGRMLDRVQDIPNLQGQIAKLRSIGALIEQQIAAVKDVTRKRNLADQLLDVQRQISADQDQQAQDAADRRQAAQQGLLDRLQFAVDRTQLTKSLQDDLGALQTQQATLKRIIATQGSTLALQQQLLAVELAIKGKQQEISDARKQRAADARQAAIDRKAEAEQAAVGWAQLGVERAQLTGTLTDDLKAQQRLLAVNSKAIGEHGKTLALEQDKVGILLAIKGIRQQQADAAAEAAKAGKDATDKALTDAEQTDRSSRKLFKRLNATAFLNQFGGTLNREQKRRLRVGLAMMGPGGTLPAGHSGQFTAGVTIHGGVHMHGVQDVPGLENQIAKRAKARPHVRRGARG